MTKEPDNLDSPGREDRVEILLIQIHRRLSGIFGLLGWIALFVTIGFVLMVLGMLSGAFAR